MTARIIIYSGMAGRGRSMQTVTNTMDLGAGQFTLSVTKVSGRRTGDGNCTGGRDYSAKGRGYSSKKKGGDPDTGEKKIVKDPVKGIRNLFGF